MPKRTCNGTNRRGEPCGAAAARDGDWCRAHDPTAAAEDRFGSSEQASRAGALGGRPRTPRVTDVMRERVEAAVDEILAPYFRAIREAKVTATYEGDVRVSDVDDLEARQRAAERLLDRVYGRPKQATELSGPDGAPLEVHAGQAVDLSKLTDDELDQLERLVRRAADA